VEKEGRKEGRKEGVWGRKAYEPRQLSTAVKVKQRGVGWHYCKFRLANYLYVV
jgi:hypothetical protein